MARGGPPRTIGRAIARTTSPILRRRGFAVSEVLQRWTAIVGSMLAQHTCPERLSFPAGKADDATLRLRVAPGFAPEVQHLTPLIIERINAYYGYRALARLKIVQAPLPTGRASALRSPRPLSPEEESRLAQVIAPVQDPALREALARFGRAIFSESEPQRP